MTMGSWSGTASQLSLPHMSVPSGARRLGWCRSADLPGRGRAGALGGRSREKLRRHGAVGRRGEVRALLARAQCRRRVERGADAARRRPRRSNAPRAHGADLEVHVGEAVAAEVRRQAVERPGSSACRFSWVVMPFIV